MSNLLRLLLLLSAIATVLVLILGSGFFGDQAAGEAGQLVSRRHDQQVLLLRSQVASQHVLVAMQAYLGGDPAGRTAAGSRRAELDDLVRRYQSLAPGDTAVADYARRVGAFDDAAGALANAGDAGTPPGRRAEATQAFDTASADLAATQERLLSASITAWMAAQQAAEQARGEALRERTYAIAMALALVLLLSLINFIRHGQPLITLARQARRALRLPPQEMPDFALDRMDPGTARELASALNTLVDQLREKYADLERANAELRELNAAVRSASQAKSAFVASISHELRTPLNAILGFSEMLLNEMYGPIPPTQHTQLERIQRNGQNLLTLINDVLDISRVEAGKVELRLEPVDPSQLAAAVAATMEPLARQKGLSWRLEVAPVLPLLITDENRLRQVLLNLLSNAVKFTRQGSVALWVGLDPTLPRWLVFRITDTGIGVPACELDLIWEEFYQVSHGLSRSAGGSGLGLSIVHKLVDVLGGDIVVTSAEGAGSEFTVYLPGAPAEAPAGAPVANHYTATGVNTTPSS